VAVARTVVGERGAPGGGSGDRHRQPAGSGCLAGDLEQRQSVPRIARRAARDQGERVAVDRRRRGYTPLGVAQRPFEERDEVVLAERPQLVDPQPRAQRRDELEVGVLGCRADEQHAALFERGQERVLLGAVEPVDLVEQEHRPRARAASAGTLDHRAHLAAAARHRGALFDRCAAGGGDEPCQRRLSAAGRSVQHQRVRCAPLERAPKRRVGRQQVALPDDFGERTRAHPRRERRPALPALRASRRGMRFLEERPFHRRRGDQRSTRASSASTASAQRSGASSKTKCPASSNTASSAWGRSFAKRCAPPTGA